MKRILLFCLMLFAVSTRAQNPYITTAPFVSGLSNPLAMAHCNDQRVFIVQKAGQIRIVDALTGALTSTPFLDIDPKVGSSGSEQGLLGMAFHPDYKNNGYFYVNYTNNSGNTVISRYSVNPADSNLALSASEFILYTINQPFSNHNGGNLAFGPDGYLYIGMGDGGSGGDPMNNGQNINALLGKMLRIDVSHGDSAMIPATNPYVNNLGAKPEIWHTGMRNPWRYSFDRLTGDFWIGDVGQNAVEEIDFQPASSAGGENWGWRCYEGNSPFNTTGCQPQNTYDAPVYDFSHAGGNCSVTGGYVYRGAKYGNLNGYYLFTDYCSPLLRTLHLTSTDTSYLAHSTAPSSSVSFGEDMYGELYIFNMSGGSVARIVDTTSCSPAVEISTNDTIQLCDTTGFISTAYHPGMVYNWYKDNISLPYTEASIPVNADGEYVVVVLNPQTLCIGSDTVYVKMGNPAIQINWTGNIYSDTAICANLIPFILLSATPAGGIFYGPFISSDTLNTQAFIQNGNVGDKLIEYRFTDTLGCVYSDVLKVNYGICSGLTERENKNFTLYPNPAKSEVNVMLVSAAATGNEWILADAAGRELKRGNVNTGTKNFSIVLENFEPGTYFFSYRDYGKFTSGTLVVVH